jgi:hypothetical protein
MKLSIIVFATLLSTTFATLYASPIAKDFVVLQQIIDQAYLNIDLSVDLNSKQLANQPFLQIVELRLKFAQNTLGHAGFLDLDYLNIGLYVISLRCKRPKAALLVLKRQLAEETNPRLQSWLQKRITLLENNKQKLNAEKEFSALRLLFN